MQFITKLEWDEHVWRLIAPVYAEAFPENGSKTKSMTDDSYSGPSLSFTGESIGIGRVGVTLRMTSGAM